MTITATELETAGVSFGGALLGYLVSVASLTSAAFEHGLIVGGIAALAVLGYHVVSGNVTATTTKA